MVVGLMGQVHTPVRNQIQYFRLFPLLTTCVHLCPLVSTSSNSFLLPEMPTPQSFLIFPFISLSFVSFSPMKRTFQLDFQDITFAEAYARTGRLVNITCTPKKVPSTNTVENIYSASYAGLINRNLSESILDQAVEWIRSSFNGFGPNFMA